MTTPTTRDIVARLRARMLPVMAAAGLHNYQVNEKPDPLCQEAADLIERLSSPAGDVVERVAVVLAKHFGEGTHDDPRDDPAIMEVAAALAASQPQASRDSVLDCERELGLLYNYERVDAAQFTRWQMMTAIRHGYNCATPPPINAEEERARIVEACRQRAIVLFQSYARGVHQGDEDSYMWSVNAFSNEIAIAFAHLDDRIERASHNQPELPGTDELPSDHHFTSWLMSFGDTPRSPRSLAQLWESRTKP